MKILIIIQRSNGDVFLSNPLIQGLYKHYINPLIDIIVNDDTLGIAKTLPYIHEIITFSYKKKKDGFLSMINQEKKIVQRIWRKYDLAINLTASDRSTQYAILASKNSISAVDKESRKTWWKKIFLKNYYILDFKKHIVQNNCKPLEILEIMPAVLKVEPSVSLQAVKKMKDILKHKNIKKFFIFHPSAQYDYKIYPKNLRDEIFDSLTSNDIELVVTGTTNDIDLRLKKELPQNKMIHDFIGETSLEELIALISLSSGYIGMDTMTMHIAASLEKPIFAIFGPTLTSMWRPWQNNPHQYIKIFQANMPCVPCGLSGCDNKHGKSECLYNISPTIIAQEIIDFAK